MSCSTPPRLPWTKRHPPRPDGHSQRDNRLLKRRDHQPRASGYRICRIDLEQGLSTIRRHLRRNVAIDRKSPNGMSRYRPSPRFAPPGRFVPRIGLLARRASRTGSSPGRRGRLRGSFSRRRSSPSPAWNTRPPCCRSVPAPVQQRIVRRQPEVDRASPPPCCSSARSSACGPGAVNPEPQRVFEPPLASCRAYSQASSGTSLADLQEVPEVPPSINSIAR